MIKLSMSEEEMLKRKYTRPYEKRIAELEEKISILLSCKNCPENKGGLICAKEYENKCLAQKIQYIKELQEENAELKTKKIPQLERRIASIRGSHRVDVKKLNARIEQVERLKKENAELKTVIALKDEEMGCIETDFNTFKSQAKELLKKVLDLKKIVTKAEEYLLLEEAEQFLSEVDK